MDFFRAQADARRQTGRLIFFFTLGLIGLIAALYVVVLFVYQANEPDEVKRLSAEGWPTWFNPELLGAVSLATATIVAVGSGFKTLQLSQGGETVALMLGGRPINSDTRDPGERKILNVVEEMAIAAGVPVPPVYLLENEAGINAFAAGTKPSNAVVGVTRGSVDLLTRDELQGVMGHEFSHILNGDMRINIRMTGLIFGILVISIIGYYMMRAASGFGPTYGLSKERSKGDGRLFLVAVGAALYVIGYVGVFFAQLIRAAVSRQREYLADSAAVQFTRNPAGIAGALAKIGGYSAGSRVREVHAEEVSHLFFSTAVFQLFATHPPLADRIKRIDPSWDGTFPSPTKVPDEPPRKSVPRKGPLPFPFPMGKEGVLGRVGGPTNEHLATAAVLLDSLEEPVNQAAHEPFSAQALLYSLLLHADQEVRGRQLAHLQRELKPSIFESTLKLVPVVQAMSAATRLPAVELALPALRQLSPGQYNHFRDNVMNLVHADHRITLFEFVLQLFVIRCLDERFGLRSSRPASIADKRLVAADVACVVGLMARLGSKDARSAKTVFELAWKEFDAQGPVPNVSPEDWTLPAFAESLERLAEGVPPLKQSIVAAAAACVIADEKVDVPEFELLRTIAAVLETPMPPLQVTDSSA